VNAAGFPGREMSPALADLFLLNAAETETNFGLRPRLKAEGIEAVEPG